MEVKNSIHVLQPDAISKEPTATLLSAILAPCLQYLKRAGKRFVSSHLDNGYTFLVFTVPTAAESPTPGCDRLQRNFADASLLRCERYGLLRFSWWARAEAGPQTMGLRGAQPMAPAVRTLAYRLAVLWQLPPQTDPRLWIQNAGPCRLPIADLTVGGL